MEDPMAEELRTYRTEEYFDRCDALLEAAEDHLLNGRPERALAIWQQLMSEGGLDADYARAAYAAYLFDQGRDDKALTELAAVMAERRVFSGPWRLAAEMLEERGDLVAALVWYCAATRCLTAEQLAIRHGPPWAEELRAGQRRLKWMLGIPLDDADLLAEIGDAEAGDKWFDLLELMGEPEVIEGRLHFWVRAEFEHARRRWPSQVKATSADAYYQAVERVLRVRDRRCVVLPWVLRSWLRLVDVANTARHVGELRSVASRYDDGAGVEWPPGRNQPCWCGSGTKYKKCCGANRTAA
jgi:hypothetical protein